MRTLIAAALLVAATPSFAREFTTGTIAALDLTKQTVTLTDKTVYDLRNGALFPETLTVGDRVTVNYVSEGEDGIEKVVALTKF
ncbi:hypothetical protein [Roseovarius aestuariivivens]|uniref:hypothetical protein n=1 Tax=Roseovarius aestuariivivens TaxID=1888910 RepID=UPI0010813FF2|nr:hypothetical protein [Roseovarius aestuariivivens]